VRPIVPPSDSRRITKVGVRARNLERRFSRPRTQQVIFDGLGSVLATGDDWNPLTIHCDGIITGWRVASKEIGDLVIDIWKTDFAGYPATVADTITAAAQPTLSAAQIAEDTTLAGWTTDFSAGDVFMFNVDSVSGITKATLTLALAT
jgi:hypothetical protein